MNPKNILNCSPEEYNADGIGVVGSPACGDMMGIYIKVKDSKIIDMKWKTYGCASAIASTSALSEMVELSLYEGLPHNLCEVIISPELASKALKWLIIEMENRYQLLSERQCRDIKSYNKISEKKCHILF